MLHSLSLEMPVETNQCIQQVAIKSNYNRNEKEDMKRAIELLYDFKKALSELHPNCLSLIENMLQYKRVY